MMFLLLAFLLSQDQCSSTRSLDGLTARGILSSASHGPFLLIDLVSPGNAPAAESVLFDFESQQVCTIDDGRMHPSLDRMIMATDNSRFLMAEPSSQRFIWLSAKGKWLEDLRFTAFEGFNGGRVVSMVPYSHGRVVLNFRDEEDDGRLLLGYFELTTKTFHWLYAHDEAEYLKSHFVPSGGKWFLIVPETGEVIGYDQKFRREQTLREPLEPVFLLDDSMKKVRELLSRQGGGLFYSYLAGPRPMGDTFIYRLRLPAEERKRGLAVPDKNNSRLFELTDGKLIEIDGGLWVIGRFQDQTLVFDEEEWSFSLR
jgi:hypothetical protein